jgi:hypothetical protein
MELLNIITKHFISFNDEHRFHLRKGKIFMTIAVRSSRAKSAKVPLTNRFDPTQQYKFSNGHKFLLQIFGMCVRMKCILQKIFDIHIGKL